MESNSNDKDIDSSLNDESNDGVNETNESIQDSFPTRSLRPSTTAATSTVKSKPRKEDKGSKRKSVSNHSQSASKIPKYENVVVFLESKVILLSEKASILDRKKLTTIPPKEGSFGVGDLIWAKMQGYPWWPCMITIDPITGEFFKNSSSSFKADIVYHIQYFGSKPYRGWTSIGMVMPFEGYDKFRKMIEHEMFDLDKKKRAKVEAKYFVRNSMLKKWNESVSEAEEALLLDIEDRVNTLTFTYVNMTPQKPTSLNKSSKSLNSEDNLNSSKKSKGDVYAFDDDDDASDNASFPEFVLRKRVQKADYNVFFQKHLNEEMVNHPELTRTEIKNKLKKQWDELDDEVRSIYVERKAIYEDESNMLVSKRLNFDDDYFNDESDYEYNDIASNDSSSHVTNNFDDSKVDTTLSDSVKKRRIKSKKSEKLFDKIKNNDLDSKNNSINEDQNDSKLKMKRKSKTDLNATNEEKNKKVRRTSKVKNENNGEMEPDCQSDSSVSEISDKKVNIKSKFCFQCGFMNKKELLVNCIGNCGRRYHLNCCKDTSMTKLDTKKFLCDECRDGKYKCYSCKDENDLETKKCEVESCNKYYHLRCIEGCPIEVNENGNTFKCPSHKCINCYEMKIDGDQNKSKKLLKCIRCPLAFHNTPICVSAGMVILTDEYIICPNHYDEFNTNRLNRHINVNHCMSCLQVGELICCEKCPLAFHERCLEFKIDPNKSFYCSNCLTHKQMHYDDVVWVKLGSYRWWPGQIKNPADVPKNVSSVKYQYCQFPVYFFGTHDYYWVNKGRSFQFVDGDANSPQKVHGGKKLQHEFNLAIEEAKEAYSEWIVAKAEKIRSALKKPLPYQHIHSNRYLTNKNCSNNELNRHICDCKKEMENPCSNDDCLNRISLIECDPKFCPAGDKCQNQNFRKNNYAKLETFRTLNTGWGLRAKEDIKKGNFVIEYMGDVIDEQECKRRLQESNSSNFYFFTLDKDNIIDARPRGNLSRFINHSCDPNCTTQKWMVSNLTRIGIFAIKDIPTGTELTFDYNLDCWGNVNVECLCKSENCSGFIGQRIKDDQKHLMNGKNGKNKNST